MSGSSSYPRPFENFGTAKLHQLTWEAEGVLRVSFKRGPVNSWVEPMWRELDAIFRHVATDTDVFAVVLSGEGRCFTAGLDLGSDSLGQVMEDAGPDVARRAFAMKRWVGEFQAAVSQMERCGKPVIAAVHNVAYGLGIDLLCAVDIRLAESTARFSVKEVDAGLAADIGTLQRLPKIVGNQSLVRELCFTAREFSAKEALDMGFLSQLVDGGRDAVLKAAIDMAKVVASKAPVALRGTKELLLHARDHTVQQGLDYTALWSASMLQSEDIPVAVRFSFAYCSSSSEQIC